MDTTGTQSVAQRAATFVGGNRPAVSESSLYDPLVEFLEIAVETKVGAAAAEIAWKVHGPDANGAYGGLQGIGGLEAVYTHSSASVSTGTWTGVIDDYYGHVVAYVGGEEATSTTLHWQRTRSIGYGPAPDSPVFYVSEGASLVQATAWRGRRQDITGFNYIGARYYEPTSFFTPETTTRPSNKLAADEPTDTRFAWHPFRERLSRSGGDGVRVSALLWPESGCLLGLHQRFRRANKRPHPEHPHTDQQRACTGS